MSDKHLSSQFDADLNAVSSKVLEMGGLVEAQITEAMYALNEFDRAAAERVIEAEDRHTPSHGPPPEERANITPRGHPPPRDLRLLMSISKTITNLERAGDEAEKIAKRVRRLGDEPAARGVNIAEIKVSGDMAVTILRRALDAFARLDTVSAAQIVKDDKEIDQEFRAFVRKLVSYMQEDPRMISVGLDYLFIAKAIERIGDHAKNIAEFIIYIVKGTDVRHQPRDRLDREANS